MNLSNDIWSDDNKLRLAFSWLTRIGVAPKFGSLPIAYYQQDQCKAIDTIVAHAARFGLGATRLRYKNGHIQAWQARADTFRPQWRTVSTIICGKILPATIPPDYANYLQSLEITD